MRSPVLLLLVVAAATAASGMPTVAPKPAPGEGFLVEYEVTLRQALATDAASVLLRVAAEHHGIVTELDPERMRAVITLPSSRGAGLAEDPLVKVSAPAGTSGRRIDHLKPVTMTTPLWNSGTYRYDAAGNITGIGNDAFQYDAVNRLKSGTLQGSTQTYTQTYTYDAFGNRTFADALNHGCARGMDCAIPVSVDPATNRLTQATIATTTYPVLYDVAGNVTKFTDTEFGYDALGSMVSRNDGQGPVFIYDANDERVGWHDTGQWKFTVRDVSGRQLREYTTPTGAGQTMWGTGAWTWTRDHIYRGEQLLTS